MKLLVVLIPLAVLGACSKDPEPVATTPAQCMAAYNEKIFDQCVAGCIKCESGVTTTCATACRLRGARDPVDRAK